MQNGGRFAFLISSTLLACSTGEASGGGEGGGGGDGGRGAGDLIGSFSVVLNPAIDTSGPYTSVFGSVYSGAYPTDVIETPVAQNDVCTVYRFSRQSCSDPVCTTAETCVATNVCRPKPELVSVGAVSLRGIGDAEVALSSINNNYQFAGKLDYPGFDEGDPITLSTSGGYYPATSIRASGVAANELHASTYVLARDTALALEWTPGDARVAASVSVLLNISKHGGSAGYLKCEVADTGALTIPADLVSALVDLGVAGFPQLTFRRSTRGEARVGNGVVALEITSVTVPTLEVAGYCSCVNASECGACADKTKTACDSLKRLCHAP